MINLNFKRNKDGMYVVNDDNIKFYDVQHCVNESSNEPYEKNVWLVNGGDKVLAKRPFFGNFEPKTYMMLTFGELLFSEFAKQNNIPCADTDIGIFNNEEPITFSKSVLDPDGEVVYMTDLERLSGNHNMIPIFTVDQIERAVRGVCKTQGINLDMFLRKNLIKLTLADFLSCQVDRNYTNINFELIFKKDGPEIRLMPMFDNEGAYGFCDLQTEYLERPNLFESIFKGERADENRELLESIEYLAKENFIPQLGIYTTTEPDFWFDSGCRGLLERLNKDNVSELARGVFIKELAEEIVNDIELSNFYKNLKFDAYECGRKINKDTGFVIPKCFLTLAQNLYDYRKKELDEMLSKINNNEMGEDE